VRNAAALPTIESASPPRGERHQAGAGHPDARFVRQFGERLLDLAAALCLADADGGIVYANAPFQRLAEAIDGADTVPWSTVRLAQVARRAATETMPMEVEESVSCRGVKRYLRCRYSYLGAGRDDAIMLAAQYEDMTAEWALRQRATDLQVRLEDLTRLVSDWLWETDQGLNFTFVSPRVMEVLGLHPREVIGRNLLSLGRFQSEPGGPASHPAAFEHHGSFRNLVFEVAGKAGDRRVFHLSGIAVFDPIDQTFRGYRGTATDITEAVEARAHAAVSRAQLIEAVESFSAGFALCDASDRLILCNRTYRAMFAPNRQALAPGDDLSAFMAGRFAIGAVRLAKGGHKTWIERRRALWRTAAVCYEMTLSDGRWLQVNDRRTADGGSVSICVDVTELKGRELALAQAKAKADEANQAKSNFLATVSHELRTPLNALIGFSDIMRNRLFGSLGDSRYEEYAADIHASAEHLLSLINDLLDASKAEAGRLGLAEEEVDPVEVIDAALRLSREQARQCGVGLHEPPCLEPGRAELPRLLADRQRLTQILLNLLSNAIKFTPNGGRVDIDARVDDDGSFVLEVRDTGIGIAEADIPKVMTPFVQADSSLSRRFNGTGLGLPLSKWLAELHGGHLHLDSRLGGGTTATVRLPKARVLAG
jgi:PAS domain S-box-containing protein